MRQAKKDEPKSKDINYDDANDDDNIICHKENPLKCKDEKTDRQYHKVAHTQ